MTPPGYDPKKFLHVFDGDEREAEKKVAKLFEKLTKFFEWRRCHPADEKAQETLFRGFNKIAGGTEVFAKDPNSFFFGIANFVMLESWTRSEPSEEVDPEAMVSPVPSPGRQAESRILLTQGLSVLPRAERQLLIAYYNGDQKDREALAAKLNMTANNLRVKVHRLALQVRERLQPRLPEEK